TRSSIWAPLRLSEPWSDGVTIRTRGVDPSTAARLCSALGAVGAVGAGCPWAWGSGAGWPFCVLAAGGFAVGKYLFAAHVQPSRMSALSTTARIIFLLSFTGDPSSWHWVG